MAQLYIDAMHTDLLVELPVDAAVVHSLAARVDDAGEIDGAAGLNEQLARTHDGRARL